MNYPVSKPSLIVDKHKCKQKIASMLEKARKHHLIFRPHFKTHQSIEIGKWYKELGVNKITVSSLDMATYFASDGWDDITVAFPANWLEIDKINDLNAKITLNIVVVSLETITFLSQNLKEELGIFIKIDTGYHRTGVDPNDTELINSIIEVIKQSSKLNLLGFLAHNGHTYHAKSVDEIAEIHLLSLQILSQLKAKYESEESPVLISLGDTPGISLMDNFEGVDEIRPGNFIFYDLVQEQIGSCGFNDISVALACPIVAKHPERNTIIIYGGGVHFSKEFLMDDEGHKVFGLIVRLEKNGWSDPIPDCYLSSVSQEHGVINSTESFLKEIKIGNVIGILPVHSCMTADLQSAYYDLAGNTIPNYRCPK
jgi:D-serine deaminase-like pyridoxal phosphate-dependent protein